MARAVPAEDFQVKTFEFNGEVYSVKNKFPMFKFFTLLDTNPGAALALSLDKESLERLQEVDMDMADFKVVLEKISNAISGDSTGN